MSASSGSLLARCSNWYLARPSSAESGGPGEAGAAVLTVLAVPEELLEDVELAPGPRASLRSSISSTDVKDDSDVVVAAAEAGGCSSAAVIAEAEAAESRWVAAAAAAAIAGGACAPAAPAARSSSMA